MHPTAVGCALLREHVRETQDWLSPFQKSVGSAKQAILRLEQRAMTLDPATAETVLADLEQLIEQADKVKATIRERHSPDEVDDRGSV
jgi:hypothetical protein